MSSHIGLSVLLDMKCQTCGTDNPTDAQFCGMCGTSLYAHGHSTAEEPPFELPMVSFTEAIKLGFRNYFKFSGRSTRAEYWWWVLFITLVSTMLSITNCGINIATQGQSSILQNLFSLATLIPSLALGSRRLHDVSKSGWWQLGIVLLVIVGVGSVIFGILAMIFDMFGDNGPFGVGLILILMGLSALLAGFISWIIWCTRKGEYGPNMYGLDPRLPTSQ